MYRVGITRNRDNAESPIRRIGGVLLPFLVYYAGFAVCFFFLSYFLQRITGLVAAEEEEVAKTATGIVNGISMVAGAALLLPMLREELQWHQASYSSQKHCDGQAAGNGSRSDRLPSGGQGRFFLLTVILAASSAVGLNIFLALTGLVQNAAGYQEVAQRQYGVTFGVGLFLYVLVSPLAEEVVFRGVIYNRLRRIFYGVGNEIKLYGEQGRLVLAMVLSGLLFGIYHGNLVQGIYGGCMGVLISYMYERTHSFYVPCLFHAVANCVVYLMAQHVVVQEKLFTVPFCMVLFGITVFTIFLVEKQLETAAAAADRHG